MTVFGVVGGVGLVGRPTRGAFMIG